MQLLIEDYKLPEKISFNFEELKKELTEKVSFYETLVYSDDQIKQAKEDKANLNKLKKALSDERIRRKKEYLAPFDVFEAQIKEITEIIDKPINAIDSTVKEFEQKQKDEKQKAIIGLFCSLNHPEWLILSAIQDDKWLNASVRMSAIEKEMSDRIARIESDMLTLANLPEFGFEACEVYKSTLDITKAISEAQRMSQIAKAKAEAETKKEEFKATQAEALDQIKTEEELAKSVNEIMQEDNCQWLSFRCFLSVDQAKALKEFFNNNNIQFEKI